MAFFVANFVKHANNVVFRLARAHARVRTGDIAQMRAAGESLLALGCRAGAWGTTPPLRHTAGQAAFVALALSRRHRVFIGGETLAFFAFDVTRTDSL